MCAGTGEAGEWRRGGAGQWGERRPGARRGQGASPFGSSPAHRAPGHTLRDVTAPLEPMGAGSWLSLAPTGPRQGRCSRRGRSGPCRLSTPKPFFCCRVPFPIPGLFAWSSDVGSQGTCFPTSSLVTRGLHPASNPRPLSRKHRGKALQEKQQQGFHFPAWCSSLARGGPGCVQASVVSF